MKIENGRNTFIELEDLINDNLLVLVSEHPDVVLKFKYDLYYNEGNYTIRISEDIKDQSLRNKMYDIIKDTIHLFHKIKSV
ncbi:hypothetical protein [Mucilaginibacter paludis]|uniref:Uncharacterized protein n=1 Tax=Mucilaginibacter paludis DSM 18603 TaxID=714943 RepID=H1YD77_9SPHI|nr:hypothetical protein [Mucilaginibacter paludis]EHQ27103.1 hypothetical protein Mucpa_2996 [Mucilaginibacter paludis DSM 18603]